MLRGLRQGAAPVAALEDDLRRSMYLFIRGRGAPVSRDEAAEQVGISRKLAAFHLDKLVERGLLVAHYARLPGRTGAGAGRSSKLYEPSDLEIDVSIPERRYDIVGDIMVTALNQDSTDSPRDVAKRVAYSKGLEVGEEVKARLKLRPPGSERALAVAEETLTDYGYEPYRDEGKVVSLRNCPFHNLSRKAPELVCGLNREFIDGLLRGLGNNSVEASLEPKPGECCVKLRPGKER
ncbi:MAG TPA: transcriptional regulator [Actinomycetota bacterium]|nr:transcriptional regulator [Actinomycetota bacterium]